MADDRCEGGTPPELSLVCSTIGRPEAVARLVRSLAREAQSGVHFELVVVDQDPEQRCLAVLHDADLPFPWRHLTSGLGASVGRNAGLAAARGLVIGFPDDNAWFPGHTLRAVLDVFAARPELGIVCGRQLTADGRPSMLRWATSARVVTKGNHHRTSIASTMFLRRQALAGIPWFDEDLGVGASTWYGACEESDLLIRAIDAGAAAWYDPEIVVLQEDPRDELPAGFRTKMLRYGCGQGRLWRLHHMPAVHVGGLLGRKVAKVLQLLARREVEGARAEVAWVHGAVCGLIDRPPRRFAGMPSSTAARDGASIGRPPGWGAGAVTVAGVAVDAPVRGRHAPGDGPSPGTVPAPSPPGRTEAGGGPSAAVGVRARRPLRITQVLATAEFAGTERYVVEVGSELARRGHEVVAIGGQPAAMQRLLSPSVRWHPGSSLSDVAATLVRGGRRDIIHSHISRADFAALLAAPVTGGRRLSTRHITNRRGYSAAAQRAAVPLRALLAREIAVSRFVSEQLERPADVVLINGVRPVEDARGEREPLVLVAQRLAPEKDTATALRAWAASGLGQRGWRLQVAGSGGERAALEDLAAELGISSTTTFVGWLDDLDEVLRSASIFLAPAPVEPCGLTILEAMAHGVPVVAAGSGGNLETIGLEPSAALFAPGDPGAAAAHLVRLAEDDVARHDYGQALQRLQRERLSIQAHVDRLEQLYLAVAG